MSSKRTLVILVAVLLACAAPRGTESRDLIDRAADAAHGLGRLVGAHVDNAKRLGHIIGKEFKSVDKELTQLTKSVGKTVAHGSKDIGHAVGKAVDRHEHTLKKVVKTVEHTHAANARAKHDAVRKVSKVLHAQQA